MLLTITLHHQPATDLGYLLHKHPGRLQSMELAFGMAHVFYPEATEVRCTAALLLDINPLDLAKNSRHLAGDAFALGKYVNDRPYVASSFLSVAIAKHFGTALNGKSKDRPELASQPLDFEVSVAALPAPRGGELLIRKLFEPLGYEVEVKRQPLDKIFASWGESKYFSLRLKNKVTLGELLSHLYVLIPVLDNDKHYFVGPDEVEKLLEKGKGWLENHPEKTQITSRYLRNLGKFTRQALAVLLQAEGDSPDENAEAEEETAPDVAAETVHGKRLKLVRDKLRESGARRVLDLGCGEGKLLRLLLRENQFEFILGVDVSWKELTAASRRLNFAEMPPRLRSRIEILQGSLTYRDKRLEGFDAAAVVEVIEHLDPPRLEAFEKVLFKYARPKTIVLTTPNAEYNQKFEALNAGQFRHADHRFEWTRAEFREWAERIGGQYQYKAEFFAAGEEDPETGALTQMAVFTYADKNS